MSTPKKYRSGQVMMTNFTGPTDAQVFMLIEPLGNLGGAHGGHWRIRYLKSQQSSQVLVDSCTEAPPELVAKLNLKASSQCGALADAALFYKEATGYDPTKYIAAVNAGASFQGRANALLADLAWHHTRTQEINRSIRIRINKAIS